MSEKTINKIPNVPNLRFPEFIDNGWQKRKFCEIADFYKGNGISKEQLTLEGNECILYGELYTTYETETITDIKSKTNIDTRGLFFSKKNDVIIPASGETPIDIATAHCVDKDNVLLGGDLNIIRLKSDNGSFVSCQLNGKRKIAIAKIAQGASIVHLHNDDLKKLYLYMPVTHEEQTKIVKLITLIDKRIKSQIKIIKELQKQINSIGYTMVKSINETISLKDVCYFEKKTKHQSGDGLLEGIYPFFTNEEETVKYFNSYDFNGECVIANTGGKANFKYFNGKFATMSDCLVIKFKNEILTKFYAIVLVSLQKYIDHVGFEGSGLKHLNKGWLLKLQLPKFGAKAQKFINIIDSLKKKLQKEKDILSLYNKQKAYLLQNVFI